MSTDGGGLNLFIPHPASPDSSTFRHWRAYNEGLPDDNIKDMSIDDRQRLWLSTEIGLLSFDTETHWVNAYTLPGSINALNVLGREGPGEALCVGNAQFIYRFHPDSIWRNDQAPPVFITDIQVDGRSDTFSLSQSPLYTDSLNLNYRQSDLTFTFTALNFIQPGKNQYRYFLEGYDQDTTQVRATRRYARYTNLAPGEYTFRVMASNNEGVWNDTGKSIAIVIHPPWWRTPAAYVLWIILLLGGIYSLYRFQLLRKLEKAERLRLAELNELRTRLYTNITHEFRTPITVILGVARQIERRLSENARENLQLIKRNGRHLLQLVNQILDLSKLESGHLKLEYERGDVTGYLKYLLKSFHSLAGSRGIEKAKGLIPDIIITDVMMPEKNGYELCRSLKAFGMNSHIPIIMLTAKVDVDSRLTGFRQGADAYLEKPFLEEELQVRMEGLLVQRQKLQAYYRSKLTGNESPDAQIESGENHKVQDEFLLKIDQVINSNLANKKGNNRPFPNTLCSVSNIFTACFECK